MPIQSPALRESPANLLFSRPAGHSSSLTSSSMGKAELFSSVLNAQNARPSLAETARNAQNQPTARQHESKTETRRKDSQRNERNTVERDDDRKAESAHESEDTDRADQREADDDNETAQAEVIAQVAIAAAQPAIADTAVAGAIVKQDVETAAQANSTAAATNTPTQIRGDVTGTANNAQQTPVQDDGAADSVDEQPTQTRQRAVNEQPAPQTRSRDDRAQQQQGEESTSQPETATKRTGSPTAQAAADAGEKTANATQTDRDASVEAARRTPTDSFRQSETTATQVRDDNRDKDANRQPRERAATAHTAEHVTKVNEKQSAVQEATQREIDALINGEGNSKDIRAMKFERAENAQPQQAAPDAAAARTPIQTSAQPAGHAPTLDLSANASLTTATTTTPTITPTSIAAPTLAGEAAAQSAANANGTEWMTRSDHAAGRILRGLTAMVGQNGGTMTMRLDPPELGALRIQMTISNGTVSANFAANEGAARSLLEQNMGQLRTALESQGLIVDKLSIQTAHSSQNSAHTGSQQGSDGRSGNEQQSQHTDAGQGESRGRQEYEGNQQRSNREFFDPAALLDVNERNEFASRFFNRTETRIPA